MGVTGSGKSTFIKTASGNSQVGVGHDLHSCNLDTQHSTSCTLVANAVIVTSEVEPFEFEHEGHKIILIDTPGFNDTTRSETEVLKAIADYLDFTFRNPPHLKLTGIIYLQSIMDTRIYGSSLRNLKMFKDLVGPDPLGNVILATSRWGMAERVDLDRAVQREQELRTSEDFWAPMLQRGSHLARFEDTKDSALQLIMSLVEQNPVILQIQKELVQDGKKLIDTAAGNTVNEETKRLEEKYKAEIAQIQKEMDEALAARDKEVQEALQKSEKDFQRKLDRVREQQDMLRYEQRNESRRRQDEYDQLRAAHEKQLKHDLSEQKLGYDEIVAQLKANNAKLRQEQQNVVDAKIHEMNKKDKKDRTGVKLVLGLLPLVGTVIFGVLGLPNPLSVSSAGGY
jgi:hypothetical protein